MLKAHGLRYARNGQEILANVDVTIEPGESLAVTGPSGSGKTTLLALLSGLAVPTAGEVYLDGKTLTKFAGPALGVAVVLEGYGLVSLLTAAENVEIALGAAGRPAATALSTARSVLARLGLEAHADQLIEELSGGQQQRTAVARALALEPRLLIADEPTAELDPAARALALAAMFAVAASGGSLILATHDPEVAARCDRIIDLRAGHVHSRQDQLRAGPPRPQLRQPDLPAAERLQQSPRHKPSHALPDPVPAAQEISELAGPQAQNAPPGWPGRLAPSAAPAGQAEPAQLPPGRPSPSAIPPGVLPPQQPRPGYALSASPEHARITRPGLPPLRRRGAMLRDYLEEVRRRAHDTAPLAGASGQQQPRQAGQAGLVPAEARPGPDDQALDHQALVELAREDLAGFADLGLRLLDLHQRVDVAATSGDPLAIVPRCLSCMWRWPCPTFLTLAEILDRESLLGPR
jgi:putative ABC transport system ATP-binding protein